MLVNKDHSWGKRVYWKALAYNLKYPTHMWGNMYDEARFSALQLFVDLKRNEYVLDFGCGTGMVEQFVPIGINIVGIDNRLSSLERAYIENPCSAYIRSDGTKTPFKDNAFDKIIVISVIEAMRPPERQPAIDEIHRILKPEGEALIMIANGAHWTFQGSKFRMYKEDILGMVDPDKFGLTWMAFENHDPDRWNTFILKKRP